MPGEVERGSLNNGSGNASAYPKTALNTVRVYKQRGHYDYRTVHSILASTFVSHVSFIIKDEEGEPIPMNLPLTAVLGRYDPNNPLPEDDGDEEQYMHQQESMTDGPADLYLHGNAASLLCKAIKENGSVRVCISSTKVDGVVMFFTPNGHSLNYRSVVVHGDAELVSSLEERRYAMHLLTNHMVRRRWSGTNPVSPSAVKSVQVMRVKIRSASAKVRASNIGSFEPREMGTRQDVWTGVVPLYEVLGTPVSSGGFPEREVQEHLEDWRSTRNEAEKSYAERVAIPSDVELSSWQKVTSE
ncbi:hypothetical protein C8Q69DRAFT_505873 [Paecilomyces variotii]|uniref:Flavin-nucleotide-binding protein n=1 Tax=Byssochlamys spectabilis TaxID=264951 RepID=A0A443HZ08_BYSSP|nr:hypothetical protein C8Q69DRAFT_505873 [Paecilomyces variotii]KAJ9314370.1 hypothetical protein DTO271D3_5347 [Paecilomyces variotii]KAJ9357598.1 hypothetical protein DTO027B9_2916 [Paecilomyces variotii]KAJ9362647.1 hypothetical protein DTO280E4_3300 [Paecilomyces variotii]KAJ9389933.1 hypothetical protein DTO063F5_1705 [Paecilomyces variotii]RWQ97000.1 hypothetical protein C8Q69DRAFT_505873 [Paecilomyces variotii]